MYRFSDGTEKLIFSSGEEETRFSDGTIQRIGANQHKIIIYPNGQKVKDGYIYRCTTLTKKLIFLIFLLKDQFLPDGIKIREFPNGKIKKFYPNGAVEED